MSKAKVEEVLNLFPEVAWDRWMGELEAELGIGVFGWIDRGDGRSDFLFLRIDKDGAWMCVTSSARYSAEFAGRLHMTDARGHVGCKRVAEHFLNVRVVPRAEARAGAADGASTAAREARALPCSSREGALGAADGASTAAREARALPGKGGGR